MVVKRSLLNKAKDIELDTRKRDSFSDEELELALAWLNGELRLGQVALAMDKSIGGVYSFLALAAREIFQGKYDQKVKGN